MSSSSPGTSTSAVEVLNVSPRGIWILVNEREYFLDSKSYPWFQDARLREVYEVELIRGRALRWPALDVDLELASLERPQDYPLVARPRKGR